MKKTIQGGFCCFFSSEDGPCFNFVASIVCFLNFFFGVSIISIKELRPRLQGDRPVGV